MRRFEVELLFHLLALCGRLILWEAFFGLFFSVKRLRTALWVFTALLKIWLIVIIIFPLIYGHFLNQYPCSIISLSLLALVCCFVVSYGCARWHDSIVLEADMKIEGWIAWIRNMSASAGRLDLFPLHLWQYASASFVPWAFNEVEDVLSVILIIPFIIEIT